MFFRSLFLPLVSLSTSLSLPIFAVYSSRTPIQNTLTNAQNQNQNQNQNHTAHYYNNSNTSPSPSSASSSSPSSLSSSPSSSSSPSCHFCEDQTELFTSLMNKVNESTTQESNHKHPPSSLSHSKHQIPIPIPLLPCSPRISLFGRSTWTFLHTTAAAYPNTPTREQQKHMESLINATANLFPCGHCAAHMREYMGENPLINHLGSARNISLYLCEFHNEINRMKGKREFDCSRVMERWGNIVDNTGQRIPKGEEKCDPRPYGDRDDEEEEKKKGKGEGEGRESTKT